MDEDAVAADTAVSSESLGCVPDVSDAATTSPSVHTSDDADENLDDVESDVENDGAKTKSKRRRSASAASVRKQRKAHYLVQKEEKAVLLSEISTLQSHVDVLTRRADGMYDAKLEQKAIENQRLQEVIRNQQLSLAATQAIVSGFLHAGQASALHTPIRLGLNWGERQRMLQAMKDTKLRNAYDYVQMRSHFLDPLKPHHSNERSCSDAGDCLSMSLDVFQFENVTSLGQVYDALLNYLFNIEINISERLGHITVREDYECDDVTSVANYRLVSTSPGSDVTVESNCMLFSRFFEAGEFPAANGEACGIITVDCIDDDVLYPYSPHERIRKDITAGIVLTSRLKPTPAGDVLVVTMVRAADLKLYYPQFDVDAEILQELRDDIRGWGRVMIKTVREILKKPSASGL
ncbi:hypothetical protein FI667_g7640, partial [Globisporangium splendens]